MVYGVIHVTNDPLKQVLPAQQTYTLDIGTVEVVRCSIMRVLLPLVIVLYLGVATIHFRAYTMP